MRKIQLVNANFHLETSKNYDNYFVMLIGGNNF